MAFSLSDYGWEAPVCPPSVPNIATPTLPTSGTILLLSTPGVHGSCVYINSVDNSVIVPVGLSDLSPFSPQPPPWVDSPQRFSKNVLASKHSNIVYGGSGSTRTSYLSILGSDNFNPAAGEPFTIDCQYYCAASGYNCSTVIGNQWFSIGHSPAFALGCTIAGVAMGVSGNTFAQNTWIHIALTRDSSGVFRFFLNGVLCGTLTNNAALTTNSNFTLFPGGCGGGDKLNYIAELRVIRGNAVWTANFTPPSASYI